jgi:biopolymer transport protein ExbB/TolQ
MGFKLSLILGGLLLVSVAGSAWYIDYLNDQIAILKGNQIVLESEIQKQNDSIDKFLEQQKESQNKLNDMALANQEAQREVNKLRSTFAKHDLDNLAINKPALVENMINRGTARVKDDLIKITNPNQFNEEDNTN